MNYKEIKGQQSNNKLLDIFFKCLFIFERERERERERARQSVSRGEAEREQDTESKANSRLRAVSTQPDTGLKSTNCEIMT